jgi:uncharacterized protein with PIN domain
MEIRFHLDEQVGKAVAVGLRLHGIDVTSAGEVGLLGSTDPTQLAFATGENRVLVTHDRDFLRLHAAGVSHAGIAYCHQDKHTIGTLIRALVVIHGSASSEELRNAVAFL